MSVRLAAIATFAWLPLVGSVSPATTVICAALWEVAPTAASTEPVRERAGASCSDSPTTSRPARRPDRFRQPHGVASGKRPDRFRHAVLVREEEHVHAQDLPPAHRVQSGTPSLKLGP